MEALRRAVAKLTVYVHPSNAADVERAVRRQLSALLFSYEDRFDGVLLAHRVEFEGKKEERKAKILNGLVPYFGVQVRAELLLFSPQPDMILEGTVEMLGKESIHAITLGVFSVAIMSDDIRKKFKFKRKGGGKFVSRSDKEHVIERGSLIRFSIKRVDTEMNCHITGSLVPPHTGSVHWLSEHDADYASKVNRFGYSVEDADYASEFNGSGYTDTCFHDTCDDTCATQISSREGRSIDIKVEQNEQPPTALNKERPHKSRKRKVEERSRDVHIKIEQEERPHKSRKRSVEIR